MLFEFRSEQGYLPGGDLGRDYANEVFLPLLSGFDGTLDDRYGLTTDSTEPPAAFAAGGGLVLQVAGRAAGTAAMEFITAGGDWTALDAGAGDDWVRVTADGYAQVDAGPGDDVVVVASDADAVLTAGPGADQMIAGAGNDILSTGSPDADNGSTYMAGGRGADSYFVSGSTYTVIEDESVLSTGDYSLRTVRDAVYWDGQGALQIRNFDSADRLLIKEMVVAGRYVDSFETFEAMVAEGLIRVDGEFQWDNTWDQPYAYGVHHIDFGEGRVVELLGGDFGAVPLSGANLTFYGTFG